ncbi:DUF881 domain-containing protein [bacterium]|nr:MAG: DUF881 domain-containing protein [bacterium]
MNPFATRSRPQSWVYPVSALSLLLGFMISLAWVTQVNRRSRFSMLSSDQSSRVSEAGVDIDKFTELSNEVNKLREEKTRLENTLAAGKGQTQLLNTSLQESKAFAGLTEVEGPGIVITLRDSQKGGGSQAYDQIVHDLDVLRTVNELFASGAEAISVNKHRVSLGTTFRCVGPTILVDDVKIASPVVIRALGDADTLAGGMNLPGGILAEFRTSDSEMVSLERVEKMTLPAYAGSTDFKIAKVPAGKP